MGNTGKSEKGKTAEGKAAERKAAERISKLYNDRNVAAEQLRSPRKDHQPPENQLSVQQVHAPQSDRRIVYRCMIPGDYDKVYALWMSCKNMGFNNLDDSREGIEKYLRRNPATCFVAEEEDQIIGVILSGHDGRRGFIHHMAVGERYRRRGIATVLVDMALAALKEEGIHKVALLVFNRNEAGNAFWESKGFSARTDLTYRNLALTEMVRIDT